MLIVNRLLAHETYLPLCVVENSNKIIQQRIYSIGYYMGADMV